METIIIDEKWAELRAGAGRELARKSDGKPVGTRARVLRTDTDAWTEVEPAAQDAIDAEARYKERVVALIRQRYDADDEIALIANAGDGDEAHAAEYAAWQAYRADCKTRARKEAAEEGGLK